MGSRGRKLVELAKQCRFSSSSEMDSDEDILDVSASSCSSDIDQDINLSENLQCGGKLH